jgi:hypothetical protein
VGGAQAVAAPEAAVVRQAYEPHIGEAPLRLSQSASVIRHVDGADAPADEPCHGGMAKRADALVPGIGGCIEQGYHWSAFPCQVFTVC